MKYKKDVYKNLALITQLSIHMMTPMFLCLFIGLYIDKRFDIGVTLPLFILGILAGGRNAYLLAVRSAKEPDQKGKDDD